MARRLPLLLVLVAAFAAPALAGDNYGQQKASLDAKSFQDVLDQVDYFSAIAAQDKRVASEVASAKREIKIARLKTAKARLSVRQQERLVNARVQQQAYLVGQLVTSQHKLAGAR